VSGHGLSSKVWLTSALDVTDVGPVERYVMLREELFERRGTSLHDDDVEERYAAALSDCRREMSAEDEARMHSLLARSHDHDLVFRLPAHWRVPGASFIRQIAPWRAFVNPHADEAARETFKFFASIGCTPSERARAAMFDVAGYAGIPFPTIGRDALVFMAKYLSLWLLWDDVHVESLEHGWKIKMNQSPLPGVSARGLDTRFDAGWWILFAEMAERRTSAWMINLCEAMSMWSRAAIEEAAPDKFDSFCEHLDRRIRTIGMYATVHLIEDAGGYELPQVFHDDPDVRSLVKLSNALVGIGNDVFGLGKDLARGQANLVTTLADEAGCTGREALAQVISMHGDLVGDFDALAGAIAGRWSTWGAGLVRVDEWLDAVRLASIGFTIWESRSPRYQTNVVMCDGQALRPEIVFDGGE
jgi:hypothetical protein